ncbi:MAG TPA: HAMP domain-containing sensor histidine kinase [Gaiellaceae bacterium]
MSFRARLTLVAAAAVALAVVAASAVAFVVVRNELRGQVDSTLRSREATIAHSQFPPHSEQGPDGDTYLDLGPDVPRDTWARLVTPAGTTLRTFGSPALPVDRHVREAAGQGGSQYFTDVSASGRQYRVLTIPGSTGTALQLIRDLTDVNRTLHRLSLLLTLIALGGIAVAAGLGLVVSRAALRPVRRLTETAENVSETGDLSQRIEVTGHDELSRLATSFNTMLGALEESSRAQRQLVADASHELRTPLTSLRTNIEVLAGERTLPPEDREKLLSDVVEQLGEMTTLIAELIELARAEQHPEPAEDVRLDLLAEDAVERARRNSPNVTFSTDFEESLVHGAPSTIERAVANLLDNAAKWSPVDGNVEVAVHGGEVTVRDHGPGIADEDLPYVFDRFYRASAARGLPGSGLGLAIVKQVAEAHGGTVAAERPDGGGTLMRLRLNGRAAS